MWVSGVVCACVRCAVLGLLLGTPAASLAGLGPCLSSAWKHGQDSYLEEMVREGEDNVPGGFAPRCGEAMVKRHIQVL